MRAIYFTLSNRYLVEKYDLQLHQLDHTHKMQNPNYRQRSERKDGKLKKWLKRKVKSMSKEYKSTFLRMGIELYLELTILSLLNIRYLKYENEYQLASLVIS